MKKPEDLDRRDLSSRWTRKQGSFTRHGSKRMRQRSIPRHMVEIVQDWGCVRYCGRGCTSYSFDKKSWGCFMKACGNEAKALERARNIYVVIAGDGAIVTAAHRW
jgi:hypothetical protein